MGLVEFLLLAFIAVLVTWGFTWAIDMFAPGHPAIINRLAWGACVFVLLWMLVQATGLLRHDIKIPSV